MSGVWGREKPRQASPKIYEEAASNPRPGDSVRQLSPLHQACPSNRQNNRLKEMAYHDNRVAFKRYVNRLNDCLDEQKESRLSK